MTRPHFYRHLDDDSKLSLEMDLSALAEKLCSMNYGVHRLLSHLVDARRRRLEEACRRIEIEGGGQSLAKRLRAEGDALANGIEELLLEGLV